MCEHVAVILGTLASVVQTKISMGSFTIKCFTDVHPPIRIYCFNVGELLTFPPTQQRVNILQISDIPISLSCTFCLMVNMTNIVIKINMLALSDVSIAHNTDVAA